LSLAEMPLLRKPLLPESEESSTVAGTAEPP
jgi:hypothetical protein